MTVALADDGDEPTPGVRWTPDEQLVDAALVGSQRMRDLAAEDRSWVVAGLRRMNLTAERIADLLHCSLRQVRAVAAEPATILAALYMAEREHFADTHRMSASEIARLDALAKDNAEQAERYRVQLARLVELHVVPSTFRCGCPRDKYNTYVDPRTGKTSCREHRRLAVVRHRERKRNENALSQ